MEGKRYANEHRPKELYLDNTLVSNFRLSYQFSQGDQPLQHELMVAIARKYNPEEFIQKFPTSQFLDEELWGKIGKIKLPTPHVTAMGGADGDVAISSGVVVSELRKRWPIQVRIFATIPIADFQDGFYHTIEPDLEIEIKTVLGKTKEDLLFDITLVMLERDIRFVDFGRPERKGTNKDPYESFVRTYALGLKPTTSCEFDQLFREIGQLIKRDLSFSNGISSDHAVIPQDKDMQKAVGDLKKLWEQKHPGEIFSQL